MADRDWQQALDDAAGILDARDRERAAEAERADEAALWASAPEPVVDECWSDRGGRRSSAQLTSYERVWLASDGVAIGAEHPLREEAIRLWKAAWVERERASRVRQRVQAAAAIARETLNRQAEATRKKRDRLRTRVTVEGIPHETVSEFDPSCTGMVVHPEAGDLSKAKMRELYDAMRATLEKRTAAAVMGTPPSPPTPRVPQVGDTVEVFLKGELRWVSGRVDDTGAGYYAGIFSVCCNAEDVSVCRSHDEEGKHWRWPQATTPHPPTCVRAGDRIECEYKGTWYPAVVEIVLPSSEFRARETGGAHDPRGPDPLLWLFMSASERGWRWRWPEAKA